MKTRSAFIAVAVAMTFAGTAWAEPFRAPIAQNCGRTALPGGIPAQTTVNYGVALRYYDKNNALIAAPLPTFGSGVVIQSPVTQELGFVVQSANSVSSILVCTGFLATSLIEPVSETEANVHVAVEFAYLSPDIIARRESSQPFTAAPTPQSIVVDKSIRMKTGDVISFDVPGNSPFARLEVAFSAWKP